MRKLLTSALLLVPLAYSAEFYNYEYTDPMSDRLYVVSSLEAATAIDVDYSRRAWLKMICSENAFFVTVTNNNPIKTRVEVDTLEVRFLPSADVNFDAAGEIGELIFFNFSDYSLQNMSNTEMRIRHSNSGRQRWYYSFNIPAIETAAAYQACKAQN